MKIQHVFFSSPAVSSLDGYLGLFLLKEWFSIFKVNLVQFRKCDLYGDVWGISCHLLVWTPGVEGQVEQGKSLVPFKGYKVKMNYWILARDLYTTKMFHCSIVFSKTYARGLWLVTWWLALHVKFVSIWRTVIICLVLELLHSITWTPHRLGEWYSPLLQW